MPIENFLIEQELKSYVPELGRLLWSEETDFTPQKIQAYSELNNELSSRGFNPAEIMPRLYIRKAGITETSHHITESTDADAAARLRYVLDVKQFSEGGLKIFTLEGSNDNSYWEAIDSRKAESQGITTFIISRSFLYYRLNVSVTGGSIDYTAFMCDTGLEKLAAYKWLELILLDRISEEGDQYHIKMKYFKNEYDTLLDKIKIWVDMDSGGSLSRDEFNTSTIRILK